ncbi:UNVERIFIED_CONTAM: hypothetical protein K2H54_057432 [Gekko kuhli]
MTGRKGTIIDVSGDYKFMFIKCGIVMVLAGLFLFIMNYYNYRMLAKEEKKKKCEVAKKNDEHLRKESKDSNIQNTKLMQDGPETVPLKTEKEAADSTNES